MPATQTNCELARPSASLGMLSRHHTPNLSNGSQTEPIRIKNHKYSQIIGRDKIFEKRVASHALFDATKPLGGAMPRHTREGIAAPYSSARRYTRRQP